MEQTEATKQVSPEMARIAEHRARNRATATRFDLDVAAFFFATSMLVIILVFQGIGVQIVAPVAVAGLAMSWLIGQRKGRQQYKSLYDEELLKLAVEWQMAFKENVWERVEEDVKKELDSA